MTGPEVEAVLASHWGRGTQVSPLGSLQDAVYRVLDDRGAPLGAARVSTSRVDDDEVEAEARLLEHLARALPGLDLPVLQPAEDGSLLHRAGGASVRLMRWVRGVPLAAWSRLPDQAAHELGSVAGRVTSALGGFDAASLHRHREWDPRHAVAVTEHYASRCPDGLRDVVDVALARTREALSHPGTASLPWQVVHMDLTDLNVLGEFGPRGTFEATSIVDFEDMAWSWRLCEPAVTAHAMIGRRPQDPLGVLAPVLAGFLEHARLSEPEADLLWDVLVARALTCAVVEAVEALDQPDNEYAHRVAALDATGLRAVVGVDPWFARAFVRHACGFRPAPDLAVPAGEDLTPIVEQGGAAGYQTAVELADADRDHAAPDAMALGTVLRPAEPCPVVAPAGCEVVAVAGGSVTLRLRTPGGHGAHLRIEGVETDLVAGTSLSRGDALGVVASDAGVVRDLHVQLMGGPAWPSTGRVRDADLWRRLCPDPQDLLPAPARVLPPASRPEDMVERRSRHVASVQRTYYRTPPQIVAGRGQWLYDSTGRRYLDMVNNVAVAGHSHPRITAAAVEQLALLSTNSRFVYEAIADYADKIVATLPPELDTVMLVNSGSEAVELALQVARASTGRHDVVVMDGAYHGWTTELVELGTLEADRPGWRDRLAPWVHVADAPDVYRGPHGDDVAAYVGSVEAQCEAALAHGGPAAFVHEPVLGSRGGVVPPAGYLRAAYDVVRACRRAVRRRRGAGRLRPDRGELLELRQPRRHPGHRGQRQGRRERPSPRVRRLPQGGRGAVRRLRDLLLHRRRQPGLLPDRRGRAGRHPRGGAAGERPSGG